VFAIEHRKDGQSILVNQLLGSSIGGGIARILLRVVGAASTRREVLGPHARVRLGAAAQQIVWEATTRGIRYRVTLRVLPEDAAWLWRVDVTNGSEHPVPIDTIFAQDLGLGSRLFVANNEAYASQYIDHHVATDRRLGPVVMSRQNLAQDGRHPWVMHGCLDGAAAFCDRCNATVRSASP
jgi:cellobiose phosphorylase